MIGALEKLPQIAYPPELKILTQAARNRVLAAQKAQDYYDGTFWRYIDSERIGWGKAVNLPDSNTDYGQRTEDKAFDAVPSKLEFRYPKFLIDELASWMFENPVGLKTKNEDYYAKLEDIHRRNKLDQKLLQSAGEGCKTGGVAVKVLYDPFLQQVRTIFRPSRECFPIMNADDIEIMEKVHFCNFQDDDKTVWRQTFWMENGVCYVMEALFDIGKIGETSEPVPKQILRAPGPLYQDNKPIDFIPVTIIPNEPQLGETFGESDLEPLYVPINEVCRKLSDASDALRFELFAIKLLLNVEESQLDKFDISPGAVWYLQDGDTDHKADARNLESSMGGMDQLHTYVNVLLDMLHQFSGVPRVTRDKIDAVGNISGVALKLMFSSIVSKCNRKMVYWRDGLNQVYDHALRTANVYEGFAYDPEKLDLQVIATPRIPQNELEQLEIQAKKIEMLVIKIVDILKDMGIEEPEKYFAEVLAEKVQIDTALTPDAVYGDAIERAARKAEEDKEGE